MPGRRGEHMHVRLTMIGFAAVLLLAGAEARAAELLMVERTGCAWCERWRAQVGPVYPKTDEGRTAPLRRADLDRMPEDLSLAGPVVFTPTFILVDDGREIGRITGYADESMFWGLLGSLLRKHAGGAG
ncbi:hypothetical protein [Prosthecomicrobium sp. N25]|uniref:hypothetical protein n=1 Tax=Prosthecomicrobium sp. N25 TaxID=3129254 RepID=UPI0030777E8A